MRQRTQRKTAKSPAANQAARRFSIVLVFFAFWALGIGARLVYLQTRQHDFLLEKAVEQRQREMKSKPLRGSILDRAGRELATTLEVESLWVDPAELENVEATAYRLAPALGEKPNALLKTFNEARENKRRFLWLARELDKESAEKIRATGVPGLRWRKEQKRFYPHGNLAAQVIGFANKEDVGQAGIEMSQEKNLRGEYSEIVEEHDGKGRVYERAERIGQTPRKVVLTLDYGVQYRTEQALAEGVRNANAKSGTAVVLNPKNGEILAMATLPSFNPNEPGEVSPELLSNRAVQNLYEPGSTFKLVTYSAAIEENAARPDETINASAGFIKIGQRQIRDDHPVRTPMTLTEALAKSSNVAAVTVGQRLGKETLYEYVRRFGYGAATGIELPAETRGRLAPPDKWNQDSSASISIGYEIGVTTLQSAAAYAAIANGGVRVAPHVVKEIQEEDGTVFATANPEQRRVVSERTAAEMRRMLSAVTAHGTGKLAQVEDYSSAGKTGTAHKFDVQAKRYSNKYVASFVGFAPAENPAVVIAVMIDEPKNGHFGGDVAAPIFSDIAEQILPELKIAPNPNSFNDDSLVAKNDEKVSPSKIVQTVKDDDEPKDSQTKPETRGNTETSAKNAAKAPVANAKNVTEDKTKTAEKSKNEPRPRVVEETKKTADKKSAASSAKNKTATPPSTTAAKTKNESPPKNSNSGKTRKT